MCLRYFCLPRGGKFSIPADWLADEFEARSEAYVFTPTEDVSLVPVEDIEPRKMDRRQHLGHGGFDRKRMVDILRGIAFHAVLPPVEIVERPQNGYRYQLGNGTHRFYASIVAGFSHVPTFPGWIPDTEVLAAR